MKKLNKKGQGIFENIGAIGIGVVALAIILTVVFLIISEGQSAVVDQITGTRFNNVTKTLTNNTIITFNECIDNVDMNVVEVLNGSIDVPVVLTPGNYTIVLNTINVTCVDTETCGTTKNITYICKTGDSAYNATVSLGETTNDVPGWVPIIIITMLGSVLIGLIKVFRR